VTDGKWHLEPMDPGIGWRVWHDNAPRRRFHVLEVSSAGDGFSARLKGPKPIRGPRAVARPPETRDGIVVYVTDLLISDLVVKSLEQIYIDTTTFAEAVAGRRSRAAAGYRITDMAVEMQAKPGRPNLQRRRTPAGKK